MYAVIESGGKQYRVELGSEIQVDRLDVQPGDSITLDRVLLVADGEATAVGRPLVDGAVVSAEVLRQERGDKVVVFKYKPKARTRVKKGARAELTTLRIADIAYGDRSAATDAEAAGSQQARAAREAEKAAAQKAAADQALAAKLAAAAETSTTEPGAEAAGSSATARPASRKSPKIAEPEAAEHAPAAELETAALQPEAVEEPEAAEEAQAVEPEAVAPEAVEPETAAQGETETRKDD
jgi:large subunit ribosomal protein L21